MQEQEPVDIWMIRHEERTQKLQAEERYTRYREYILSLGIKCEKQEYPVAFGPDGLLVGLAAAKDLEAGEVYLEIPESAVINRRFLKQNTPLAPLIEKHPEIFDKFTEDDMGLIMFYFSEKLKGEASQFLPMLAITNLSDLPAFWKEEEILEFQDKVMLDYIKQYQAQYEEDWNQVYSTFKDPKYEEYFPGISDPANEQKLKETFYWAHIAGLTRFVQKEFSLKMSSMMPWVECHNHKPHEDTLYRVLDPQGNVKREFTEPREPLEPWGTADFEYFYGRPLKSIVEKRRKQLYVPEDVLRVLEEASCGNHMDLEEVEKEFEPETYQIITQHAMKKGEQICFNYGRVNNRYWILRYALAIPQNEYDAFAVHVKMSADEDDKKVYLLQRTKPVEPLLELAKLQLVAQGAAEPSEKDILERAINLIQDQYTTNFGEAPTSIETDEELLRKEPSFRLWLALQYRVHLKQIVRQHVEDLKERLNKLL